MIFPYSFLKEENLNKGFPSQQEFFNELMETGISNKEYKNAYALYKKFGCKNFRDFMELYVELDDMLLADIWLDYACEMMDDFKL